MVVCVIYIYSVFSVSFISIMKYVFVDSNKRLFHSILIQRGMVEKSQFED